jgi:hypothetical protein
MIFKLKKCLAVCISIFACAHLMAQETGTATPRKAAIFVISHEKLLDDKTSQMEDFVSSRASEKGFSIISPEIVAGAISKGTEIDAQLNENSSALRLAQNLGADYLVVVTLTSLGSEKKTFEDENIKTVNVIHTLRAGYKIIEGVQGGTLAGKTFKETKTEQFTENARSDDGDLVNGLLDDASAEIADAMGKAVVQPVAAKPNQVEWTVVCGMQDNAQLPLSIPDVRIADDNTIIIPKEKLQVVALNVTVELDGAGIGSTPGKFKASPGIHKIRLRRDGFKDYEGTINVYEGEALNVSLELTDAGYQRWKDNTAFLDALENGKKLTDADAEKIRGEAQMLRQSGNMVNIKVDTKENVHPTYKSIY